MKRLIFVEGVSGTGKSTTAAKLHEALNSSGYQASCHLEGDSDNPIDLCWFAYLTRSEFQRLILAYPPYADALAAASIVENDYILVQYQNQQTKFYSPELYGYLRNREACYKAAAPIPIDAFTAIFQNRWRRFLDSEHAERDYAVFDGAFLHHPINDLLRNFDASDEQLFKHSKAILQMIAPLKPVVFYLSSDNVEERLRKARQSRGQNAPTPDQIHFWENRKRCDLLMLENLPMESHIIDVTKDSWDGVIQNIWTTAVDATG